VGNDNYTGDIMDRAYLTITTVISGINSNTLSKTDEDSKGPDEDTKGPDEEQQVPDDETKLKPEEE
jgi:hypothetical protein